MIFSQPIESATPLRQAIRDAYLMDETACVQRCIEYANLDTTTREGVFQQACRIVQRLRDSADASKGLDALLQEYDLSSEEGVVLMCLAEALLRIPDPETADRLIREKLTQGDWVEHLGKSDSVLVNASTWGLMLTGRLIRLAPQTRHDLGAFLKNLVARGGEPLVRLALRQAMEVIGQQFVLGKSIEQALERRRQPEYQAELYSYDMLGEAALTADDARRYFDAYAHAIETIGRSEQADGWNAPGISVKLSALHPRYVFSQRGRVTAELSPRLMELVRLAKQFGLLITIDAEEADRLELSLDVFAQVYADPGLSDWYGLGIAVQAYQKRALPVLDWLMDLAQRHRRPIPVRLVKGAYWDTEIKRAQVEGLIGYPVFTRKSHTDVAYLACTRHLLNARSHLYPQFATHNAHTIAAVTTLAGNAEFEFQRLHGMGKALYALVRQHQPALQCRVYAPVGSHARLLPYLVRRLLENGANTSFVNRIVHREVPIEDVVADPIVRARDGGYEPHPRIPLPVHLYGERRNALGVNLADINELSALQAKMEAADAGEWRASPLIDGEQDGSEEEPIFNPAQRHHQVGSVSWSDPVQVNKALAAARRGYERWRITPADERARILEDAAAVLEANKGLLMTLCIREAGKTIADAAGEVREAIDYCRYYAREARQQLSMPRTLHGPSGELNTLGLCGRGVLACISPWNFPLAIFLGQVSAALAAGNSVVAKPAEQTPLTACQAVRMLYDAGLPKDVVSLLTGDGKIGAALVAHPQIDGVLVTGGTETAKTIQRSLAAKPGPIVPLIAETGGQNAMVVDSSALVEQVVIDAIQSAFNCAGQRCSALRVLFLQADVAPRIIEVLTGAMTELSVDDPALLTTDIGPLIDEHAQNAMRTHIERIKSQATILQRCSLPASTEQGRFFPPHAVEIESMSLLEREVFGPILHIIRFSANRLDKVIESINGTGYGLTLGIHSRINETVEFIVQRARVGNIYVNRNMIGAVVGIQPFGGEGLSGTGPKAGGPNYLLGLSTERTVSNNIAAVGGNADLLSIVE